MVIQEFSTTNITVIPPSRFSTGQDIDRDNLFVRKRSFVLHSIIVWYTVD